MAVELTEQQCNLIHKSSDQPVELVDPQTQQVYVLVAREQFVQMKSADNHITADAVSTPEFEIPEGIRRSQEAMRRELPKLLENKKLVGQWVAYHREERVGIAKSKMTLIEECIRRGYQSREYYVAWIDPCELIEEEELDPRPWHNGND